MNSNDLQDNYVTNIKFTLGSLSDFGLEEIAKIKERIKTEQVAHIVFEEDTRIFGAGWLSYMKEKGLVPTSVLIIGRLSQAQHPYPHLDKSLGIHDSGALNWVEDNADDSEMVWYEMPDYEGFEFPIDNRYLNFRTAELEERSRQCLGGSDNMALVRTDIPHNIYMGDVPRLAISVRFSEDEYTWAESVERMKEYIIE